MLNTDHSSAIRLVFHAASQGGMENEVSMHPDEIAACGWNAGNCVTISAVARVAGRLVAHGDIAKGSIALSPLLQAAIGVSSSGLVSIERANPLPAARITFAVIGRDVTNEERCAGAFLKRVFGQRKTAESSQASISNYVKLGDRVFMVGNLLKHNGSTLRVIKTSPQGVVRINPATKISVVDPQERQTSYQDVGGLSAEVAHIREMVEMPLRHPEVFSQLGIDAPRGVLLYGLPGCGKTLIARAIAQQTDAYFLSINGPEIIQKHYGESEELLRKVFEEAQKHPASILFIDEIDTLAPNRETVLGEVEKRVVGQLLALMDGVASRGRIVVMAATNLPNSVDPALRRPGRFDREIAINPPTKAGRLEILKIHTRFMPLAADVELERVAAVTHGFLGADLAALCREAGMASARDADASHFASPLFVRKIHFQKALANFRLSTMRELSTDIVETCWEDIGGLDEPKRLLKEALEWPLLYSARFQHARANSPTGILLTGESGTGKTLLAQAVGSTTELNFIVARGPELLSKWVGESERGIREVFRRARQSAPSIIFFDEIDAIAPSRGKSAGDGQIGDRMVGQFLLELDALDDDSSVVVLAATNRPDLVDPALLRPGRFDLVIELSKPDCPTRLEILRVQCRQSPLGNNVDLAALSDATDGFNGAELAALCQRAKMLAIRESVKNHSGADFPPFAIESKHFESALQVVRQEQRFDQARKPLHIL